MNIKTRADLVIDRIYYDERREHYFVTPDCFGGYWFDTLEEVNLSLDLPEPHHVYHLDTIPDY